MRCLVYFLFVLGAVVAQTCQPSGLVTVVGTEGATANVNCPEYSTGAGIQYTCRGGVWAVTRDRCASNTPTDFNYAANEFVLLVNQNMTAITPTVKCYNCQFVLKNHDQGAVLPTGIYLDSATGTLSGTPTELMERQTYTIIARVQRGDAEFEIAFTVTSETANYTVTIIIIVCVVLILGVFGTCLYCRIRGTGRNQRKARTLKSAGAAKTTSRV